MLSGNFIRLSNEASARGWWDLPPRHPHYAPSCRRRCSVAGAARPDRRGAARSGRAPTRHLHAHGRGTPSTITETVRSRASSHSTRKTRCQRPSWSRPPTTFRHSVERSTSARACAWPFGRSPGARFTVRTSKRSCCQPAPRPALQQRPEVFVQERLVLVQEQRRAGVQALQIQEAVLDAGAIHAARQLVGQVGEVHRARRSDLERAAPRAQRRARGVRRWKAGAAAIDVLPGFGLSERQPVAGAGSARGARK